MDILGQSTRPIPRLVLAYRAPAIARQIRLYTKYTINASRKKQSAILPGPQGPAQMPDSVEAFGKLRAPHSGAAEVERWRESRKLEKLFAADDRGQKIYVYVHLRTGQVVYSMTKVMENHKILSQLVFHGKKTLPPALRRDHWTPYMSIHLPTSYAGLMAYRLLRELSRHRQLSPPDNLIMTTKQTLRPKQKREMDLEERMAWEENVEGTEFEDGLPHLMHKKDRARSLMFQRKTAVADVAFAISLLEQRGRLIGPLAVEKELNQRREAQLEGLGNNKKKKLLASRRRQEAEVQERKRRRLAEKHSTKWGLESKIARRIAMEHGGVVVNKSLANTKALLPPPRMEAAVTPSTDVAIDTSAQANTRPGSDKADPPPHVDIFWSDLRDATYAREWSPVVSHGELERVAVSRERIRSANYNSTVFSSRSVHVIGDGTSFGAMASDAEGGGVVDERYAWMRAKTTETMVPRREAKEGHGEDG